MIRYDKSNDEIVLCREYSTDAEALYAKSVLEEAGIPCLIDNMLFSRIYPVGFNSLGGLRIMVRQRDLERATRLLDEIPDVE